MTIKTQGMLLFYVAADGNVTKLGCPTSIDLGDPSKSKIDVTCLEEIEQKQFIDGLSEAAEAQIGVNFDPKKVEHISLYSESEKKEKVTLSFALAWSDGTSLPTYTKATKKWTLPTTRSWCSFDATVSSFPFSFDPDSVVKANIKLIRKTEVKFTPKT